MDDLNLILIYMYPVSKRLFGAPSHGIFVSVPYQENQAFRARRREETQGTDDPVLNCHCSSVYIHL